MFFLIQGSLDLDSRVFRVSERFGFCNAQEDVLQFEFHEQCPGEAFRKGFDQIKPACRNISRNPVGDLFVIEGISKVIVCGSLPDGSRELKVDDDLLFPDPFPGKRSDNAADLKSLNEYFIYHIRSVAFHGVLFNRRHGTGERLREQNSTRLGGSFSVNYRIMSTPMAVSVQSKPLCPLFGTCGGCQYQDISYEEELSRKEGLLKELLSKELDLPENVFEPITASPESYYYRNRLDLTLRKRNNGERQMGFMLPGTQRLQEVSVCPIARKEINAFLPVLKEEAVRKLPDDYKTANLVVRVGEEGKVAWGGIGRRSLRMKEEDYFWTLVRGRKIFYALDTFFQANLSILEKIVSRIESLIAWRKDTVFLDLYSGVGLFGIALADRAKEVVMIEEVGDSVTLARFNVSHHNLGHVKILAGKVETHLPEVLKELDNRPCVALIDPPRGGLAASAIETLGKARTLGSLLYLSCSPGSLARDLKHLAKVGWEVRKIMPFDFFPRTRHLETLVWLGRL